ncbi:hypothetical protein McpSp1_13220 [Methanocorpusculaceae archaeon Sp1]|nr:hypothetical protein [Methanocorpusculaceae archaeon Sp1]
MQGSKPFTNSTDKRDSMAKYVCVTCGYLYDETKGAPPTVPAGTEFEKIPDTWVCPMCGASKKYFAKRG